MVSLTPFIPPHHFLQAVGFVHGVLNTDNMSILGVTIDFGPYGFMDKFNPMYTPNMTDFSGRRCVFESGISKIWEGKPVVFPVLLLLLEKEVLRFPSTLFSTQVRLPESARDRALELCDARPGV